MDKEKSEASPSPPEPIKEPVSPTELKGRNQTNNILIYLIGRQLGRPKNDMDLFEWVWTVT
ncbi:Embryonic testis differentiation protein [Lemmus lemmus]